VPRRALSTPLAVVLLVVGLFIGLVAGYGLITSNQSTPGGAVTSTTTSTKTLTSVKSSPPSTTTQTVTATGTNTTITIAGTNTIFTTTAPPVTSTQTQIAIITTRLTTTQTSFSTSTSTVTSTVTTSPPYPAIATVAHVPSDIPVTQGSFTANCTVGAAPGSNAYTHITLTDTVSTPLFVSSMSFSFSSGIYTASFQSCALGPSGSSTDVASILITGLPLKPNIGEPFAGAFNLASGMQLQFAGFFASPYNP
jgi:hypothetical protein